MNFHLKMIFQEGQFGRKMNSLEKKARFLEATDIPVDSLSLDSQRIFIMTFDGSNTSNMFDRSLRDKVFLQM